MRLHRYMKRKKREKKDFYPEPVQEKPFFTIKEAAVVAQVTTPTVINWCRKYNIGYKVGGQWRIKKENLERFLNGEFQQVEKK